MANFNLRKNPVKEGNTPYWTVLQSVRGYIISRFPDILGNNDNDSTVVSDAKKEKLKNMISRYISTEKLSVGLFSDAELVTRLYNDLAEYSVLTDYIKDENNEIEEINVNAWNDIEVRYSNGESKKVEAFCNMEHAKTILRKLATAGGALLDDAIPMAEASLTNNTRVVVLNHPIVDADVGTCCSIRLLKPQFAKREFFINNGTVTEEEMRFLELAIRSGVSMVFVGATGSGKTTLMNYLLGTIPNDQRIITIEHNARELSLVKKDEDGKILNNVVHLQTRPHELPQYDISQEDLVVKALRLDPRIICVGEMRDSEAYAAQEASLTGHTVVTSLHADGVDATHHRIATLALKRYPIDINVAMVQAAMAFPVIVYLSKLEDHSRHVMEIAECTLTEDKNTLLRHYTTLYEYQIKNNIIENGHVKIEAEHRHDGAISARLRKTMMINGATAEEVQSIMPK